MWRGVVVFAITYVIVAVPRLRLVKMDRAAGAMTGALLAVLLGAITPAEAAQAVDYTTIVLLFAVMGMGAFLSLDGFFDRAGTAISRHAKTSRRLAGITVWGAGLLSAVVTNDAVCVLAAPLVVSWIERHKAPRLPLLLALATGANTGSVATLVGNPQNMLCGSLGGLRFLPFFLHMFPVALVGLAINHGLVLLIFRRDLDTELEAIPTEPQPPIVTRRSAVTLAVIVGTVAVYATGANLALTALSAFVVLLFVHRLDPGRVWSRIDWTVLLFFGALFVAVDAFARSGAASLVFSRFPLLGSSGPSLAGWLRASAIFLVGSNVVTNVPFILVVREEMAALPNRVLGWELLAMAATFAGNLTLLGSVANVIVGEKASSVGGLRFGEYLRLGVPVALLTTLAGTLILVLMH